MSKFVVEVKNPCYNPERDIRSVEQMGFVDIVKANSMNALPATLVVDTLSFNGIDDPNSIAYRPRDSFEAAQGAKAITEYVPDEE